MIKQKTKDALKQIVGEESFSDQVIDLVAFATDASEYKNRPDCAVWVTSTEQVAAIMKLANQDLFPVVPRGAGTSLAGLTVPAEGGLVMDLGRMDKIIKISLNDRLVVVQPGVVYADLDKKLTPLGFFFPPDPASGMVATLGGNVATNAGGIRGAKYGTTRDYVLALEVVLPSGEVLHAGSQCIKSSSGYDLARMFVGSEGTLGVITEITLKINPKPTETATAMATFPTLEDAGRAVTQIVSSGVLPSVLEIMDRLTIKAINENTDLGLPDVEAVLLTETDGYTAEEAAFQIERIMGLFKANNATSVQMATDPEEAAALWAARKSVYSVLTRLNNTVAVEDLAVPLSKVADTLKIIEEVGAKYGLQLPTVGHVGDGNLHPGIAYDRTDPEQAKVVHAAASELLERVTAIGGTLTGEHGIGMSKAPHMHMEHDAVSMKTMRSLKKLFDPNNILNPGKMALES
jgi:glycolate dehydrogenase FAD-linked subunit